MQNFLDVSQINTKQQMKRTLKLLYPVAGLIATLTAFALCMIGVGVFGKLIWSLIKFGWSRF
jgi:hypothetical protein